MADAEDTLIILFSRVNRNGSLQNLPSTMVDEIWALLHHRNCGANIFYCENPENTPSYQVFSAVESN